MNYYYRKFGIRSVVLTESTEVVKRCIELNILTEPIQEVNPYGMPILRSMLLYIQEHYDVDQYIYINSDILLNPNVFNTIQIINENIRQGILPSSVELISQVKAISYILTLQNNTYEEFSNYFHSIRNKGRLRDIYSAVLIL